MISVLRKFRAQMRRERDPTAAEFEKLLCWIDPDREEAGRKLRLIHSRVIQSFVCRGCIDAQSLADEVSNRVAVRIDKVITDYPDPLRCFLGFVGNVHREYLREQRQQAAAREPPRPRPAEILEKEDECLRECLGTLANRERDLFVRYFHVDKRTKIAARKALARELNLTPNALRIQAHRLRKRLLECLERCVEQT